MRALLFYTACASLESVLAVVVRARMRDRHFDPIVMTTYRFPSRIARIARIEFEGSCSSPSHPPRMQFTVVILCALVALSAAEYKSTDDVVIFTDATFDSVIEKNQYVLAEFYAPWYVCFDVCYDWHS